MRRRTRTRRRSRRVGGVGEEEEEEEEEAVLWTAQDLTFNGGPNELYNSMSYVRNIYT